MNIVTKFSDPSNGPMIHATFYPVQLFLTEFHKIIDIRVLKAEGKYRTEIVVLPSHLIDLVCGDDFKTTFNEILNSPFSTEFSEFINGIFNGISKDVWSECEVQALLNNDEYDVVLQDMYLDPNGNNLAIAYDSFDEEREQDMTAYPGLIFRSEIKEDVVSHLSMSEMDIYEMLSKYLFIWLVVQPDIDFDVEAFTRKIAGESLLQIYPDKGNDLKN